MAPLFQKRTPSARSMAPLRNPRNGAPPPSDGPPPKKRKYIPGGPGGGGRFIEIDAVVEKKPITPTQAPPRVKEPKSVQSLSSPRRRRETATTTPLPISTPPSTRPRRDRTQSRGRYSSSTAAALAIQQGDGYKPREERGWEEFHEDLDIEVKLAVFSAEEVDGTKPQPIQNGQSQNGTTPSADGNNNDTSSITTPQAPQTPIKRRPGRPPRRPDAMLRALLTPEQPKTVPPPGPNPREKLTLPTPNFHPRDPFVRYEQKGVGQQNYVDRTMASVGYQESDLFVRHDRQLFRMAEGAIEEDLDLDPPITDGDSNAAIGSLGVGRVEYDMDEQDEKWLEDYNAKRKDDQLEPIKPAVFEITMTKIEKEWYALEKRIPKPNPKPPQTHRPRSSSAAAVNGEPVGAGEEQDSKCAVCDDGDCENSNAIVFCDGCDLAVHQECYGVPYIPEGQWLCRKCQLIGRGSPNCIFCPNTEGAFKQTNTSKWSHLLCSIWIPEVGIGNQSLMEPVTDVEKVPKSRWKLQCYICKQRMGASIQCGNKNCFVAFHVTCARRAQLYLKMKTGHGNSAIMDSHLLKAFCHKHVPPDWRKEHGTDIAYADAVEYYKNTMDGKRWGDSQAAALALGPSIPDGGEPTENNVHPGTGLHLTFNAGSNKRKRTAVPRTIWKLPSGAPVIPQTLLNSVVASLQRFTVRQRKQYAEDACKYWTLKREARRGAALLKRLQLQLETFSSMEMTRRNFVAMGPIGRSRLQRRIDFAERLTFDVDKVRTLCENMKQRETEKLEDVEVLRNIVDTVYFPIPPLLWPIFEKVQALDPKGIFSPSLQAVSARLESRFYTTVSTFSADLAHIFTNEIGVQPAEDTAELQMQISGRAPELSLDQREKRKLAKRIIKSIQPSLEEAIHKESELSGKPFEKELKELDAIFESGVLSRRISVIEVTDPDAHDLGASTNGVVEDEAVDEVKDTKAQLREDKMVTKNDEDMPMPDADTQQPASHANEDEDHKPTECNGIAPVPSDEATNGEAAAEVVEIVNEDTNQDVAKKDNASVSSSQPRPRVIGTVRSPITPPLSSQGDQQQGPLAQGGIQWYMQPFDPIGTTIHEERWTGRDVMRGMSEELSELDEDELEGLVNNEEANGLGLSTDVSDMANGIISEPVKVHRTRRRGGNYN
ncbi:putative PHD finger domain protein [Talaromyces proteolyticus]|uniref:PHD finger domain protein n=1 Tax=Talaromyces proteolyticus TaxID=1131652 RepID=A0AAD4KVK0_9EURO|nr:putative PHD finger domain protein [Talaromyces proteolyticus]KAH8700780.1 putative PHD finger domain protein [Talaromyces proteolyticus]